MAFDPSVKNAIMGVDSSKNEIYRYLLLRGKLFTADMINPLTIIGLNPSTADHKEDDPTIRRCIYFANKFGHDGLIMMNLFAFRATKPEDMRAELFPIGPLNNTYISDLSKGTIVAAWGVGGSHRGRNSEVIELLHRNAKKLFCFGVTKDGHPRHPLYLPNSSVLIPYASLE